MNLYHETLMDHYRHPRNRGVLEDANFVSEQYNPSCGDAVQFAGMMQDGIITQVMFTGKGCVISQATASLLTELVINKTVAQVCALDKNDILQLIGIELGPTRLKCALLPLQAVQEGCKQHA